MNEGEDDELLVYAVRVAEEAAQQIDRELDRLFEAAGEAPARAWRDGIDEAISSLATYPERCVTAPENPLFQSSGGQGTLRQLLYQRRRGGPTWRILFSIQAADENDPARVQVHRIQHGAQAPMTEWD